MPGAIEMSLGIDSLGLPPVLLEHFSILYDYNRLIIGSWPPVFSSPLELSACQPESWFYETPC